MANNSSDLTAKIRIDGDATGGKAALGEIEKGMQGVANEGRKTTAATDTVAASFAKLGIRSAQQIKADILAIDQALIRLAQNSAITGQEFDRAFAAGQEQIAKLNAELSGLPVEQSVKSVGGLAGAFSSLQGVLATLGITAVGEKFLAANLAADKLQKSLSAVNGDAGKTASDLAFLKETAQRLGINLESSSAAFVKLAAAAKGTSLEGQATRDIFTGLGGAMSKLGLTSAETERAFVAIGQMMSKGTVSAEELKGQLGDVLPGALQMAARATGLTTQELGKLMETGGLLAEDFLPKFAAEAERSFGQATGDVQGLSNNIERLKNTWAQAFKIFGDTGVLASLAGAVGVVSEAFLLLATGVTAVVSGFFAFVKTIAVTVAAIATLDFSGLKSSLADIGNELVDNVTKMASLTGTSKLMGNAMAGAGQATQQAARSAQSAGAGWEKLNVAYDQAAKSAADYVEQVKKVAKANDEQASVLVKLAQLSGNENDLLRAKEDAARQAASGTERLAQALDAEAKTLQAKLIALQEEVKGQQNVSAEKIKAIEEARKLAEAKGEEARAAISVADASRIAAAAAEAESAARLDNSQRLGELKAAYEQAALQVDVLRAAQASGIDVTGQMAIAQTAAAKAHALYSDALRDQTDKIAQNLSIKQSQINVEQAGIRLAIEQQRTIYEVARARGDEYGAVQALMQIKRLEIQLAELTAQAKRAEAEAALLTVQAKREELIASGQLTAAKEAELRAQEAGARVKQVESQIAGETAKRMRELAEATDLGAGSASRASGHFDGLSGSLNGVAASARQAVAAMSDLDRFEANKYGNPVSSGGFNDGGHQASSSVGGMDILYRSGASVAEAKIAAKYFDELFRRRTQAGGDSVHSTEDNNRLIAESSRAAAEEAIALARNELTTGQSTDLGASLDDITQMKLAQLSARGGNFNDIRNTMVGAAREAQNQVVRVDLRTSQNRQQSVNVSSQADAKALISTLEQLQFRTS